MLQSPVGRLSQNSPRVVESIFYTEKTSDFSSSRYIVEWLFRLFSFFYISGVHIKMKFLLTLHSKIAYQELHIEDIFAIPKFLL